MPSTIVKAVYLDGASLQLDKQIFAPLISLFSEWQSYPQTKPSEIIERIQGAHVVICNKSPLSREVIEASPALKLILVTATGTNNIDLVAAKEHNITVCNCRGYGTEAVSQHALMLILALAARLIDYNKAVAAGEWQNANNFCLMNYPIMELAGKTLGIIGYGELGQAVAKLAEAFGMKILIGQIPNRPQRDNTIALTELLPQVDILTLHCPLTEDTKNLLTEKELRTMKKDALLINTARGGIINEQDLANVLKSGHLGGAATDVLTIEPPKDGNPLLDHAIPRLIITPHCAWATKEAQQRIVEQVTENAKAFLAGKAIRTV
ncbi:2-hydroxyacid dehydrogenase [Entomomonas asaccharolytica]|uniref:2-hydroxyacid dehydrogenase n=1 Tax=Entomomonas asaccharolytica TaxID=2785331 RepID=A0A974ND68_9GAMM|nr:2-hydroxyacid dehydrogenase [Entomomonas asaccharolytica]QQP84493.1 2-hydroxyacid dehydrogenase [Entomomonas asaccharolytica]